MSAICRFIHAEKANYPITLLCRVMKAARSTYYAWAARREGGEERLRADEALAHEITVIHLFDGAGEEDVEGGGAVAGVDVAEDAAREGGVAAHGVEQPGGARLGGDAGGELGDDQAGQEDRGEEIATMVLAISKAAELGSSKLLPGCVSWVAQATATKMPPRFSAISRMARGMVR
ncbi:hypothetical protein [Streptomyces lydicus]|uniref:hypothetical protein n=1 Tax=Streptomyces lydicus TaxID=47763 RepID=UPI0036EE5A8E